MQHDDVDSISALRDGYHRKILCVEGRWGSRTETIHSQIYNSMLQEKRKDFEKTWQRRHHTGTNLVQNEWPQGKGKTCEKVEQKIAQNPERTAGKKNQRRKAGRRIWWKPSNFWGPIFRKEGRYSWESQGWGRGKFGS